MTRIASVATHMISVPRPQPVWTAHEESKGWNVILTEVRTDDGLVGYGEIHGAPMPRICEWVGRFGEIVRGMDALAHIAVCEKLFALTSPRPGGIEGRDGLPPPVPRGERAQVMAAIAGIDVALWDIKGKAAGLPVYRLLGGENRPIFTYATGGYYRPDAYDDDYGRELARFIELGYRAVKLKTGGGTVAEEAERIGAVRRAIGNEPLLMLDMNAAYDLPDCMEFARAVEPHRIFWLEEPLHWYLQPADFRPAGCGDRDPAGAWRARADPLHGTRFHCRGRHPLRAVRRNPRRRLHRGLAHRPPRRAARGNARPAYRPRVARASRACVAALRLWGRGTRWGADRPFGVWTIPQAPGIARRLPAFGDRPGFGIEVDWAFVDEYRLRA